MGVLAACVARHRTGEGQRVDTSLFEAGIIQTYWQSAIALATGVPPGALGSAHPLEAPYQAFRTDDGWINIGAANQGNWLKLVEALEAPGLALDARFKVTHRAWPIWRTWWRRWRRCLRPAPRPNGYNGWRMPAAVRRAAPVLGEHTREVLADYGFEDAEIDRMVQNRTVIAA